MAFNFHSQAATTKRKRETGFLSDDDDNDDDNSNGNNMEDDDGSIKNSKSQSLFADITTPPPQSRTRTTRTRRTRRSVDTTKLLTKSNTSKNNKQFLTSSSSSSRQYVMESTNSSSSRSLIRSNGGGSMQTFKKKKKSQMLIPKRKQRSPPPPSSTLRNSNELSSQSPETIIKDVEKIKDENGPTSSFPKNKQNTTTTTTIQSQSETLLSKDNKQKSKNIQTKIDNDTMIVESPPINRTTSKHSNNSIILQQQQQQQQQSPSPKKKQLSKRSMEKNTTQMKKKLSFTKQNSKQATKIIPGNSLKPTNNHNNTLLPRTIHNIKNTRLDITTTQQTLHNNRKSKRFVKKGQSCLEKRESYVDTKRGTNQKKGSDITKPIDLCCESSEDEIQTENDLEDPTKSQNHETKYYEKKSISLDKKIQNYENEKEYPCVRISIGNQVYSSGCFARFVFKLEKPYISFRFKVLKTKSSEKKREYAEIQEKIVFSSPEHLRYFSNEEDDNGQPSLLSKNNDLNNKKKDDDADISLDDIGNIFVIPWRDKKCNEHMIVLEIRYYDDFQEILMISRKLKWLDQVTNLSPKEVIKYIAPLLKDSRKEKKHRLTMSNKPRTRSGNKIENNDNLQTKSDQKSKDLILLVYPFDEKQSIIEEATRSLCEPSGMSCRFESEKVVWYKENHVSCPEQSTTEEKTQLNPSSKQTKARTHYLTIRTEDLDRLNDDEFLNDTLIDFWMRWISRNNDCKSTNVHFFTSHFFTALTEGPETVSSWTAKKNINIFDMKFIFIPINEQLHWSLCVVVNCDKISRVKDEPSDKDEIPCLLFFDSLKAHRKKKIASYIRKWIAFEADRLQLSLDSDCLSQETMPIVAPHIPYQENSWDCGVYVCRFAYGLYLLRNKKFLSEEVSGKRPFENLITNSPEFSFGMKDIVRLRSEMKELVVSLSNIYIQKLKRDSKLTKRKNAQRQI